MIDKASKEYKKAYRKAYYEKNKEKILEACRKYHNENKEKIKEYKKEYSKKNAAKAKMRGAKYMMNEENREKARAYAREWRTKNVGSYAAYKRTWYAEYRARHPERVKAQQAIMLLTRSGKLKRQPCVICGKTKKIEAHHCDYSKPLEVMWLCAEHHNAWHKVFLPNN